tara:strand:+ start:62 stop:493 length:432 start_codon:yes stop_codon:yes gene_type:complete
MKSVNYLKKILLIFLLLSIYSHAHSEVIILSNCKNEKDTFKKNEYILDLEKSLMTRNFIYNNKSYKKYKLTDLSIKKKNTITRFIYNEENKILTDKIGYPQFYTQLLFERDQPSIKIKTVINNEPAVSLLSKCGKIEVFDSES